MTQPPDPQMAIIQQTLQTVQQTLVTVQSAIEKLNRSVDGDTGLGMPSIRAEVNALKARVEASEQKQRDQETTNRTYARIVQWAGLGSLGTAVAVILALFKFFGGH